MDRGEIGIGMPKGLELTRGIDGLLIRRRWFSPLTVFLTVFVVFWDGFLVFWYLQATHTDSLMMKLFPIGHVLVGLGLSYRAIAGYVNHTYIRVSSGQLEIRHSPLPWPGNKKLSTNTLAQLYCKETIRSSNNSSSTSYSLHAITTDDRNIKILGGLPEQEQVIFLEQTIEKQLGIRDRAVQGELD